MNSLAVFLLAIIPQEDVVVKETVDCIERNNFYDCAGRAVFVQWIFWKWNGTRHEVIAWRLHKPEFSFQERSRLLIWAEDGKVRIIQGRYWRETWEQYDPELAEREIIPEKQRRGLRK